MCGRRSQIACRRTFQNKPVEDGQYGQYYVIHLCDRMQDAFAGVLANSTYNNSECRYKQVVLSWQETERRSRGTPAIPS